MIVVVVSENGQGYVFLVAAQERVVYNFWRVGEGVSTYSYQLNFSFILGLKYCSDQDHLHQESFSLVHSNHLTVLYFKIEWLYCHYFVMFAIKKLL